MHVLIPNLHEHAAALRQQLAGHGQPVAQVGQVGVDAQLPGVAEGADLLRLAGGVFGFAVLHVALARAHLPVGAEFDAVGRVEVDHLYPSAQPFLLRQTRHHQQRIAQDHAVGPVLLVLVELHFLGEIFRPAVEIVEELQLITGGLFRHTRPRAPGLRHEVVDQRLWVDFLLDVDGHSGHRQIGGVLFVFALPDQLRIERGIAGIAQRRRGVFVLGHEIAQLLRGDVRALVRVADGLDFRHRSPPCTTIHCHKPPAGILRAIQRIA
ncbi:MAG: hypothetical protein BWY25_02366 [Chloroflexi bacterium ADurb.Bin222]|nr:MAG: hypothetical protein BWY25_02366 [Chloroflexi bacterium ADurb.Bin222]